MAAGASCDEFQEFLSDHLAHLKDVVLNEHVRHLLNVRDSLTDGTPKSPTESEEAEEDTLGEMVKIPSCGMQRLRPQPAKPSQQKRNSDHDRSVPDSGFRPSCASMGRTSSTNSVGFPRRNLSETSNGDGSGLHRGFSLQLPVSRGPPQPSNMLSPRPSNMLSPRPSNMLSPRVSTNMRMSRMSHISQVPTTSMTMKSLLGVPLEDVMSVNGEASWKLPSASAQTTYEVHEDWAPRNAQANPARMMHLSSNEQCDSEADPDLLLNIPDLLDKSDMIFQSIVLSPNSNFRLFWNMLLILHICYDAFTVPLTFFGIETAFLETMSWVTRIFWTLDLPMSCVTGYVTSDGDFEMRFMACVRHYAKSWLFLDLTIIVIDWALVIIRSQSKAASVSRTLRALRLLRMSRLLRMAKAVRLLDTLIDRTNSEKLVIVADIFKNLSFILTVIHVIACIWFSIGNTPGGWVIAINMSHDPFWDQYSHSLSWSLTQFFGSPELFPQNTGERFFNVLVLIFAFVVATWFVSTLTSSLTRLLIITRGQQTQFAVLRRFLLSHNISPKLISRVQLNARHTLKEQERTIPERDVELLGCISETLLVDLHFEIYSPIVIVHPFFDRCGVDCMKLLRRICHECVSVMNIIKGDIVFTTGEVPAVPMMLFCVSGSLAYKPGPPGEGRPKDSVVFNGKGADRSGTCSSLLMSDEGSHKSAPKSQKTSLRSSRKSCFIRYIGAEDWLSEAVLWTPWVYAGTLRVSENCQMIGLDANRFVDVTKKVQARALPVERYAQVFVQELNDANHDRTDVGNPALCKIIVERCYGRQESSIRTAANLTKSNSTSAFRTSSDHIRKWISTKVGAKDQKQEAFSDVRGTALTRSRTT